MQLQKKVGNLSFSFGSEILNTLNNAFTYALGLLTYELIQELSKKEWDNSKFFSWFIFMIIAFLLTKFKYFYDHVFDKDEIFEVEPMIVSTSVKNLQKH